MRYFPEYLLLCLPFATILLLFALAIHYLLKFRLEERLPADIWGCVAGIAILACLLAAAAGLLSVRQVLESVGDVFASPAWQLFGLILAALIFIPLSIGALKRGNQNQGDCRFRGRSRILRVCPTAIICPLDSILSTNGRIGDFELILKEGLRRQVQH